MNSILQQEIENYVLQNVDNFFDISYNNSTIILYNKILKHKINKYHSKPINVSQCYANLFLIIISHSVYVHIDKYGCLKFKNISYITLWHAISSIWFIRQVLF